MFAGVLGVLSRILSKIEDKNYFSPKIGRVVSPPIPMEKTYPMYVFFSGRIYNSLGRYFCRTKKISEFKTWFIKSSSVVYAPALALQQLTKINLWLAASITALLCTIYTTLGGLKAVVWTDVFQCGMIMSGFVAIIVVGCMDFGGFGNLLKISEEGGRIIFDDFSIDPRVRYSVWSILLGCTFGIWGGLYGSVNFMNFW